MISVPLVLVLTAGCGRSAPVPAPGSADMWTQEPVAPIVEVAPRLYVVAGGGCNTVVFVAANGVVVVDTKYAVRWPDVVTQIRTVTDKPITHVINTHFHDDHAEGNRQLGPGVTVVAQDRAREHMAERGFLPTAGHAGPAVTTYRDRLTLFEGDDAVDLYRVGPAHTDGDTLVVFRQARVMAMGDVFPSQQFPIINIEGGGSAVTYVEELRRIAKEVSGVDRVVTGHGPVLPWAALPEFADFLTVVVDHVRGNMRFGRKKNDVFNTLALPDRFAGYDKARAFETQDEIDRSFRPRWQRFFSIESAWRRLAVESRHDSP